MKFKKNISGNPKGKPKGAKNKKTLLLDAFANHIIESGMEKFERELKKLSGKDFINAYLTMYEFVKPKIARTEIKNDVFIKPNLPSWLTCK